MKLVFSKDLVKICPKCGKKFTKEDNFCSQHSDELIELINISDLVKECKACGTKYTENFNYCAKCHYDGPLVYIVKTPKIKEIKTHPNKFYNFRAYSYHYDNIKDLLSQSNIEKLKSFNLSHSQFEDIINNIKDAYKTILNQLINDNDIDINSISTLDKILLFSKSFVKTEYKEGGGDLGHFEFNEIFIDDRATDALQITTLIHELSHFLLAEILEQIISLLLNTDKTEAIEAFVCYTLVNDELNYLIDEYCAHTVEGRFAVLGYQDYGSYKSTLSRFLEVYTEDYIEVANGIGNTFAFYIKDIMTSFINEELRMDIKNEYSKINDVPKYSELNYETNEILKWQQFSKAIQLMLTSHIDDIINNPQNMEKLKMYAVKFKKNNDGE